MTAVRIGACIVRHDASWHYTETVFADGTCVGATPNSSLDDVRRAIDLGYGGDTAAMTIGHEAGHAVLAEALSLPHSPTLWWVAHQDSVPYDAAAFGREEACVLALQATANGLPADPWIVASLRRHGCDLAAAAMRLRCVVATLTGSGDAAP